MQKIFPKIIVVRNEHPLEVSAYVLAPQVVNALKRQGFDVELRPIKKKINPKQIPYTYRDLNRSRQVIKVAKENPKAGVFSFHNISPEYFDVLIEKHKKYPQDFLAFEKTFYITHATSDSALGLISPKNLFVVEIIAEKKALPGQRFSPGFESNVADLKASKEAGFMSKAVVNAISGSIIRIAKGEQQIKIKRMLVGRDRTFSAKKQGLKTKVVGRRFTAA